MTKSGIMHWSPLIEKIFELKKPLVINNYSKYIQYVILIMKI